MNKQNKKRFLLILIRALGIILNLVLFAGYIKAMFIALDPESIEPLKSICEILGPVLGLVFGISFTIYVALIKDKIL